MPFQLEASYLIWIAYSVISYLDEVFTERHFPAAPLNTEICEYNFLG